MARKSLPSKDKSHNGLSADEFQKQLLNWFQDRGLLSDLQAHLRHQMIVALRDTSLSLHCAGAFHQAGSPKLQAINLLVAEFLLRQEYHYTLSVFTSEVPLLRNLPEFSTAVSNSTSGVDSAQEDVFPGFHERDVFDILEALGFASNSEESKIINDMYEHSQGESLLTCLIRSLPNPNRSLEKSIQSLESLESKSNVEHDATLQQSPLFTDDVRMILQQSNLGAKQITLIHNSIRRIVEEEVAKTQESEETKFRQELIDREQRIQTVWNQRDIEMQEMERKSEEKLNVEHMKLKEELNKKQTQFAILASQLQEQQHDVACRLNYIQECSDLIERKEVDLKVLRKESEEYLRKKQEEINSKEKHLEEQLAKLEFETKAREEEKKEIQTNRMQIEEASRAIKESQSEIALLRELQREHNLQMRAAREDLPSPSKTEASKKKLDTSVRKKKTELFSQGVQVDICKQKGAVPKKHNVHQQTIKVLRENQSLQTQISASDLEDVFLQLRQQNAEAERQRSQHTMFGNLVDELQQENIELRGHIEQQRLRIQELTTQASEYMQQLSRAHSTLTRLRHQPPPAEHGHHAVQTSPRLSSDSQPPSSPPAAAAAAATTSSAIPVMDSVPGLALGAYGYQSSTPPAPPLSRPVPETRPPTRGFVRCSQVGAGEESYFSRRLPPESFVPLYGSPNQRRKPPRRLMVHSVSSSDDSCPSPTEEMLREARRRLRRLEEETAAIDRSYQEFRLRHADSLTNTASILFQPLSLPRDYSTSFTFPTAQNVPARSAPQNTSAISFPTTYNRSRSYATRMGLLNQFQSTTILQPGTLQPFSYFPPPRSNDQARQSFSFTSSQTQNVPAVTLYSVPTEIFSARPQSSLGTTTTTSVMHGPPLSSARVQSDVQNTSISGGTRGDFRLPAGFSLRGQPRHSGEREPFQSVDSHQQNRNSSRWQQELPSFTSSVPHMPISTLENERQTNGPNLGSESEKPIVVLHRDSLDSQRQSNTSREFLVHHVNLLATRDTQQCDPMKDISLQSASVENIGERLLSPPLKLSISMEHDQESQVHSTKSCTALDDTDDMHSKKMTESSKLLDAVTPSRKENESLIEKELSTDSNQCDSPKGKVTPQTKSNALSTKENTVNSKGENQKKENTLQEKADQEQQDPTLRVTHLSEVVMESPTIEENKSPHVSRSGTTSNESQGSRQEFNAKGIQIIEEVKDRSQANADEIQMKHSQEIESVKSALETEHDVSSMSLLGKPNETSPADVKEQQSKTLDEDSKKGSEQHSVSPSVPSTLGSSNELCSDIVSVGDGRSDDTW